MTATVSTHVGPRELQRYAEKLIDAGFTVRVAKSLDVHGKQIPASWLVYEKNGNVGIVEQGVDGYKHLMPVRPSHEDGSAILTFNDGWALHVVHAEKTASPDNVGGPQNGRKTFRNEGLKPRHSINYDVVGKDEPRVVPVKVVWQVVQQYETVLELEVTAGQMGSKTGRQQLRGQIDEKLDDLDDDYVQECIDENWHGPIRHIETMEPIWDAVEPAPEA